MNTNLTCFLLGLPLVAFWLSGVRRGVMIGPVFGLVRRAKAPANFWSASVLYGALAVGFLIVPLLAWLGLRS